MQFGASSRSRQVALETSLPWVVLFFGAVVDLMTALYLPYERILTWTLVIACPIVAWIEFSANSLPVEKAITGWGLGFVHN